MELSRDTSQAQQRNPKRNIVESTYFWCIENYDADDDGSGSGNAADRPPAFSPVTPEFTENAKLLYNLLFSEQFIFATDNRECWEIDSDAETCGGDNNASANYANDGKCTDYEQEYSENDDDYNTVIPNMLGDSVAVYGNPPTLSNDELRRVVDKISSLIASQIDPNDRNLFNTQFVFYVLQVYAFDIRSAVEYITELFPGLLSIPLDSISSITTEPEKSLHDIITKNDKLQPDNTDTVKKCYTNHHIRDELLKLNETRRKKLVAVIRTQQNASAELDLHLFTLNEAIVVFTEAIAAANANTNIKTIKVITGRGKHSPSGKAVIRPIIIGIIIDNRLTVCNDTTQNGKVNPGAFIVKIR